MSIRKTATEIGDATPPERRGRISLIDVLRGVALIAMAIYHFSWDLEYFGYIDPGTVGHGGWKIFARVIASSFLFLAGFSLVLGHFPQLRPRAFSIRLAKITGAALLITIATWYAFPDSFIFFGILHSIAAASIVGLLFLRAPPVLTLLVALAAFVAPFYLRSAFFDVPVLWWVGLSETIPRSNDYVPLLPWLAPFLTGIAVARLALSQGWLARLVDGGAPVAAWKRPLILGSRHSLAFYLIHQPLLFSLVYVFAMVVPAAAPDPKVTFRANCVATCTRTETENLCAAFCGCTLGKLIDQNLLEPLDAGQIDVQGDARISDIAEQCTIEAQTKE